MLRSIPCHYSQQMLGNDTFIYSILPSSISLKSNRAWNWHQLDIALQGIPVSILWVKTWRVYSGGVIFPCSKYFQSHPSQNTLKVYGTLGLSKMSYVLAIVVELDMAEFCQRVWMKSEREKNKTTLCLFSLQARNFIEERRWVTSQRHT